MKKYLKKAGGFLSVFYKVLPFFLALWCYCPAFLKQAERRFPLLDAIYEAIKIYSGSTADGIELGPMMQLARFLALAATLSILVKAFDKAGDIVNWLKLRTAKVTVVYGNSEYADHLYESLPPRQRIRGEDKFIPGAARYLLMFTEDVKNIAFFHEHYADMKDSRVYLMLDGVSRQSIADPRITVFSIAESCARQYWREHPVLGDEKIAVIGFGDVGSSLLLYGLQINLIDPAQHIEYHIYGDGSEFRRAHTELDKMAPDEIVFHDEGEPDYAQMAAFNRIILCGNNGADRNLRTLSRLLAAAPLRHPVHVYAPNGDIVSGLFGAERVVCFGAAEEMASIDMVLNQKSMETARRQHEDYVRRYGGKPWEQLDSFNRYSNVSSSDYMHVVRRLIKEGVPAEKLAELEHMRWCRYHYLNNWKYAPVTDKANRLHNCLIPFAELSEEEKKKDTEAIASKMDV